MSGGRDGTMRVWDVTTGKQLYAFGMLTAYLDALQFDGAVLISSGTNDVVVKHSFLS